MAKFIPIAHLQKVYFYFECPKISVYTPIILQSENHAYTFQTLKM